MSNATPALVCDNGIQCARQDLKTIGLLCVPTHRNRRCCRICFITTCFVSFSFHQLQKSSIDWKKGSLKVDALPPEQSCEDEGLRQPEKGLSLLVQHVLGKPLDKTEQMSNWEKRPLREEQILYAGLLTDCLKVHFSLGGRVCLMSVTSKIIKRQMAIHSCMEEPAHVLFVLLWTWF